MKEFSLTGFAAFATTMITEVNHAKHGALEKVAVIIETEAKDVIGTYRYGWPQLAPATLEKKSANTPLLETGTLRDSIGHTVSGDEAQVGSNEDTAVWQELGTSRIPPRSFLVGAAQHKKDEIIKEIGHDIVKLLVR